MKTSVKLIVVMIIFDRVFVLLSRSDEMLSVSGHLTYISISLAYTSPTSFSSALLLLH
jgi:hypothetical protein